MDQKVAKKLFEEGAFLVLLDVPEKVEFGIDYNCWNVGPLFKGVKMIPPGLHFVFYSAVSREGQTAPRTGFFHFFQRQEVFVKKWSPFAEELTSNDVTDEMVERIRLNVKDLDRSLAPYPYESLKKWASLTNYISKDVLERTQPTCGVISSVTEVESEEFHMKDRHAVQMKDESENADTPSVSIPGGMFAGVGQFPSIEREPAKPSTDLPELKYKAQSVLRLSEVPKQKYPAGATPHQITQCNLDRSYALTSMLHALNNDEKEFLGELQMSFVCFLIGHVFDAFEHWKELVRLLCSCEDALVSHKDLYGNFITVLHFQLKEIPQEFFVDIVSKTNFLTITLQSFFSNLEGSSSVDKALLKKGLQFKENVTKTFKWDFDVEPEDFAPTIVDI
ncbi:hypothetical protein EMCRGX_G032893 [Ephydatia muelleri]